MTQDTADLLKKALRLPAAERADLAGSLIESLEQTKDEGVEQAWEQEITRRMRDLDSGKIELVSLEEARRRLRSTIE